jgi:hypothetical protein
MKNLSRYAAAAAFLNKSADGEDPKLPAEEAARLTSLSGKVSLVAVMTAWGIGALVGPEALADERRGPRREPVPVHRATTTVIGAGVGILLAGPHASGSRQVHAAAAGALVGFAAGTILNNPHAQTRHHPSPRERFDYRAQIAQQNAYRAAVYRQEACRNGVPLQAIYQQDVYQREVVRQDAYQQVEYASQSAYRTPDPYSQYANQEMVMQPQMEIRPSYEVPPWIPSTPGAGEWVPDPDRPEAVAQKAAQQQAQLQEMAQRQEAVQRTGIPPPPDKPAGVPGRWVYVTESNSIEKDKERAQAAKDAMVQQVEQKSPEAGGR